MMNHHWAPPVAENRASQPGASEDAHLWRRPACIPGQSGGSAGFCWLIMLKDGERSVVHHCESMVNSWWIPGWWWVNSWLVNDGRSCGCPDPPFPLAARKPCQSWVLTRPTWHWRSSPSCDVDRSPWLTWFQVERSDMVHHGSPVASRSVSHF